MIQTDCILLDQQNDKTMINNEKRIWFCYVILLSSLIYFFFLFNDYSMVSSKNFNNVISYKIIEGWLSVKLFAYKLRVSVWLRVVCV